MKNNNPYRPTTIVLASILTRQNVLGLCSLIYCTYSGSVDCTGHSRAGGGLSRLGCAAVLSCDETSLRSTRRPATSFYNDLSLYIQPWHSNRNFFTDHCFPRCGRLPSPQQHRNAQTPPDRFRFFTELLEMPYWSWKFKI